MIGTQGSSKLIFRLALVLLVAQVLIIASSWRFLPQKLPLFYSRPWGEEQLTAPIGLLLVPIFSLAVFLVNLVVMTFLSEENLVGQILVATIALFNFLNLITLIQIVRLVI
jgi:hypothetical protein